MSLKLPTDLSFVQQLVVTDTTEMIKGRITGPL